MPKIKISTNAKNNKNKINSNKIEVRARINLKTLCKISDANNHRKN